MKKILLLLLLPLLGSMMPASAQKIIEYSCGIGSRDPEDGNIWVLYKGVKASHEGMRLRADSALYNTRENSFMAFGNIVITITDTTFIYGNQLFYDGNERVVDIWDDTVVLIDGSTQLYANHVTYERNRATAYYTEWGHGVSEDRTLDSRQGQYNSNLNEFFIYNEVRLADSASTILTDTLRYNTSTKIASFESPTYIYSDSSTLYSEWGNYNTDTRFAISYRASHVDNAGRTIDSDTLFYDSQEQYGKALGNVRIVDSANDLICTGRYGETNQVRNFSFVTDSAQVVYVDQGDTLFLHADTVYVTTDDSNHLQTVRANSHVKAYRRDAQAMCDSAFYSAADSLLTLYRGPVLWYEHYQCSADTMALVHDSTGTRQVFLRGNCFAIQQVDRDKFNQLSGRHGVVHFAEGKPHHADVEGNAQMVFYISEEDSAGNPYLVGVNAGMGTAIRIYFDTAQAPSRVVTYDKPDMQTYPVMQLPEEWRRLKGFDWQALRRPRRPEDIFVW